MAYLELGLGAEGDLFSFGPSFFVSEDTLRLPDIPSNTESLQPGPLLGDSLKGQESRPLEDGKAVL